MANDVLPAIFGCDVSDLERTLFSLPARFGGLGIGDPTEMSHLAYSNSRRSSEEIVQAMKGTKEFVGEDHIDLVHQIRKETRKVREETLNSRYDSVLPLFD